MNISNLSIRQKQIFVILLNVKDFIPCKEIATKLNVSIRTVKSDVTIIKNSLKDSHLSCQFESMPSKGYRIHCSDIDKIRSAYLTDNYFFSENKYMEDDFRQVKMFFDLLNCHQFIKVKDLIDKYYISRTTLYKDLESLSKDLKRYHVELIYQPYKGVYIQGTEIDIRFAIQNKLLLNMDSIQEDYQIYFDDMRFNRDNLLDFINTFAINRISDFELSNLYHHLLTMIYRCKQHKYIDSQDLYYETFVNEFEIQKAFKFFYSNKPESFTIPRSEIIYFVLLIKGCNLGFCNQIALDVTVHSLEELSTQLKLNLNSSSRIANLSKYLYSLLIRNFNHFTQNTILLDDIREKRSLPFDISFHLVILIEKCLKIKISNNEISYLAYFFLDIKDALKAYYIPSNILLVSFMGTIMCQNLLHILQSNFSYYHFEVCELYELKYKLSENNYSFIITDVAVHINQDVPIILVSHFLESHDYQLVRQYLRMTISRLIDKYMENIIEIHFRDKYEFLASISNTEEEYNYFLIRENRMTYQFNRSVIIYLYDQDMKTSIYYHKEGLYWDNQVINYIFVINITENNSILIYAKIIDMYFHKINHE